MPVSSASDVEGLPERSITHYGAGDIRRTGVKGVSGEVGMQARVRAFGAILVIEASGSGSEIERRPLRPGFPTIDVIFVDSGEFEYLEGTAWLRSTGPLLVAPSGLPHRVRFLGDWKFVVARIPREALLPYVPMFDDAASTYSELTISERAMQAFLAQSVASEESVGEGDSRTVGRMVLEMAGALVRDRQGRKPASGTPRAAVRERALGIIADMYGDGNLTPERIAEQCTVSLRHLQDVFAEADSSVAREIRRERARVARSMLQDSNYDHHDVATLATMVGFGSASSLRRALEDLYGVGARELRASR